jgi:hypothetical protein
MLQFSMTSRKRKVILSALIVTMLTAAYLFATSYSIYRPIAFNEPAMNRAVAWVQANSDLSRREGTVSLPPSLASVSATGKAYVTNGILFFPSWQGRKMLIDDPFNSDAGWVEGYGFSLEPLPTMASEPAGSDKFFLMMDLSDPAHTPHNGENGRQMAVDRHINKSWYEIDSFS